MEADVSLPHLQVLATVPIPFPNENKKKMCFSFSGVVSLGEHNTNTDPDCEFEVWASPLQDYTPAEHILHKDYAKHQFKHGISLTQLDRHVVFSSNL